MNDEVKTGSVRVGVAGWSYPDWEGTVYPRPKPRGFDPLRYLADYIDAIEINSTFYHPGPAKNAASWARRLADRPGFKFTVKLWGRLTHEREGAGAEEVKAARVAPEVLSEAGLLGGVLAQFPWSFRNTQENREWVLRLRDWLHDLDLAVEVRHGSWDRPEVYRLFAEQGIAFVNVDQPVIGDSMGPGEKVTAARGYVRLHGRNREQWFKEGAGRDARYDYLYARQELEPWAERIAAMAGRAREVMVITNNHWRGQALVNALQLKGLLGQEATVPPTLAASYPDLFRS
jgi:uncharacterized protein YecE (DUF72 family)